MYLLPIGARILLEYLISMLGTNEHSWECVVLVKLCLILSVLSTFDDK